MCVCVSLSLSHSLPACLPGKARRQREGERGRERDHGITLSLHHSISVAQSTYSQTRSNTLTTASVLYTCIGEDRLEWERGGLLVTGKTQEIPSRVFLLGIWMVEMYCSAETIVHIARKEWLFRNSALFVHLLFYAQKLDRLSSRRHLR